MTMPTYEYRCSQGHDFERFQRMSDEPVARCPECGKKAKRLLSAGGGLLFKGSGFYITDYRPDSYKEAAKKDGKEASGSKEGSGGGSAGKKGDSAADKGTPPAGKKPDAKGSSGSSGPSSPSSKD